MKLAVLSFLLTTIVLVNGGHTFLGTNVNRTLLYHMEAKYKSNVFTKRIEYVKYTIPHLPHNFGRYIQGILAYDLTKTKASCNVTSGGVGTNFVSLRLKSDRGQPLHYDIYIYA